MQLLSARRDLSKLLSFLVKWSGGDLGRFQEFLIERYSRSVDRVHDSTLSGPSVWMQKRVQRAEAARASEAEKCPHLTVSTVFEDADLEWLTKLYLGLTDSLRIDS